MSVRRSMSWVSPATCSGAHVRQCANRDRPSINQFLGRGGNAKIGNEGMTFAIEKDVAGLDVPVDESLLVGEVKGVGHVGNDSDCFLDRWAFDLGKVLAFDQVGDDEEHPLVTTNIMNCHDPRMAKAGNPSSFFQQIVIRNISSSGDLDGHQPLKFFVEGPINLAVTAFGDQTFDSVAVGEDLRQRALWRVRAAAWQRHRP